MHGPVVLGLGPYFIELCDDSFLFERLALSSATPTFLATLPTWLLCFFPIGSGFMLLAMMPTDELSVGGMTRTPPQRPKP